MREKGGCGLVHCISRLWNGTPLTSHACNTAAAMWSLNPTLKEVSSIGFFYPRLIRAAWMASSVVQNGRSTCGNLFSASHIMVILYLFLLSLLLFYYSNAINHFDYRLHLNGSFHYSILDCSRCPGSCHQCYNFFVYIDQASIACLWVWVGDCIDIDSTISIMAMDHTTKEKRSPA